MNKILTKKEAIDFLGLDEKLFENYFRNACEFNCMERKGGGRFFFEKERIKLAPANSQMAPIFTTHVKIQGRCVGVIRKYI